MAGKKELYYSITVDGLLIFIAIFVIIVAMVVKKRIVWKLLEIKGGIKRGKEGGVRVESRTDGRE